MLESIHSPADLKRLNMAQLTQLAEDVRARLISVVSDTGGHLASNLGAVELTIAMHAVFDFSKDKLVWDVGHQAYTHKLLTGRNDAFAGLRCTDGLSGFPKICESPYDCFGTGHASTSISAAVGFALSRDLQKQRHDVLAVIGDGAMTGGMAFEALNHAGHLGLNMKVILNDNDMSIDRNVGGLSDYLTILRSNPNYNRAKSDVGSLINSIPAVGNKMAHMADRMKDSFKYMLVPGEFFEELGFKYYGPVNGHDLEALIHVFKNAKAIRKPLIIHCLTVKGKGYLPAEKRPDKFHGTGAFHIKTGEVKSEKKNATYTDVFAETLIDLAKKDDRIVGITAAMGSGTGIATFGKTFPDRVFDVGIAEEHATTMASAMALAGLKPVLALYSSFLQRGFDQLIHDAALQEAPLVVAVDRAGLVGEDGPTHHGVFDLSYLRMIPNVTVMAPKDEREFQHMLYSAFQYESTVAVRYPRGSGDGAALGSSYEFIPKGKAEQLRSGDDVAIFAIGAMVTAALEAAERLAAEGIEATVVNARFVKPLDHAMLASIIPAAAHVVTVEENVLMGGFGSAILEWMQEERMQKPVTRIGLPDAFVEQGKVTDLKERTGLTATRIFERIKDCLSDQNRGE